MTQSIKSFQHTVRRYAEQWVSDGLPSREGLDRAAKSLVQLRQKSSLPGIWERPPTLATATLDDGFGQGIAVIESFAAAIGMHIIRLGLMLTAEEIIEGCHRHKPEFLGLTVLQFDTEEDLVFIAERLPPPTRIVAGGPVFTGDPDFAERAGTHYAAKNVADFLLFMLAKATERVT
jgi:methylmalonyl-CoA mutase cobalamin-binding subunit